MYNEQLEKLIAAALADGVLTDKERAILLKRAKSFGIDEDEFEMVLESRLSQWKKEHEAKGEVKKPVVKIISSAAPMSSSSAAPMFSKELESLIQATLEDGVLEDYEKAALVKRATAEGVDLAELEIYINSIMQKRKKEHDKVENAKQDEIDQKKREAFGRVCPNCGKQVTSMTLKCDCGYEFTKGTQISSSQVLADKIAEINSKYKGYVTDDDTFDNAKKKSAQTKEIIDAITLFPVPNNKEDIIEFLSMSVANSTLRGGLWGTITGRFKIFGTIEAVYIVVGFILCKLNHVQIMHDNEGLLYVMSIFLFLGFFGAATFLIGQDIINSNKIAMAWRDKFSQVMMKARSLRGDKEFTERLDYFEEQVK